MYSEIGPSNNMQLNALIGDNLEQLGITKHSGPRYSNYSTFESRSKSFKNWPSHLKQTPSIMAQAGFFYLGKYECIDLSLLRWDHFMILLANFG